jgi:putative spermidine/putrescine transport system permease protein
VASADEQRIAERGNAAAPAAVTHPRATLGRWLVDWGPAIPLLVVVFVMLVAPAITLIIQSFLTSSGSFTLEHWASILGSRGAQRAVGTSLGIGVVSATISLVVGGPAAWLITRMLPASRSFWLAMLNVAANFGGIGLAFGYVATLGTLGMITLALRSLGIAFEPPAPSSFLGLVLAYEYTNIPLFVLLTVPAMGILRREWREAAAVASATAWQDWSRIGLPVLTPFLSASWLLIFTWSIGLYGLPFAMGGADGSGRIRLITLEIGITLQSSFSGPQEAAVLAVLLMLIASVSLITYRLILRRALQWFS